MARCTAAHRWALSPKGRFTLVDSGHLSRTIAPKSLMPRCFRYRLRSGRTLLHADASNRLEIGRLAITTCEIVWLFATDGARNCRRGDRVMLTRYGDTPQPARWSFGSILRVG
jgi:hypothetical protein